MDLASGDDAARLAAEGLSAGADAELSDAGKRPHPDSRHDERSIALNWGESTSGPAAIHTTVFLLRNKPDPQSKLPPVWLTLRENAGRGAPADPPLDHRAEASVRAGVPAG